jgi:hypothetical protein
MKHCHALSSLLSNTILSKMSNNAYYEEKYSYSAYPYDNQYPPKTILESVKNAHAPEYGQESPIQDTFDQEFPLSSSTADSGSAGKSKRDRPRSHTPRPSNSFILYRREKHLEIMQQYKGVKTLNNNVISKIVANMWRQESPEVKAHFAAMADAEKRAHMLKYPDYKYRPRKAASKKTAAVRKPTLAPREVKMVPVPEYATGLATYPMMNHQQQLPYMVPSMGYHHNLDQIPRMSMMEHEQERYDQFVISPTYEQDFLHQDALLTPTDYTHAWPMQPVNQVWDLGLEKPFENINE